MTVGKIICVGLGPGDPELMSVRADRLVRSAQHVAYFRKPGRKGQARTLVEGMLDQRAIEYPMEYPVTTEIPFDDPEYKTLLSNFYEHWTDRLVELSRGGTDVIVLCEGDPFFYGSFMHLHCRLQGKADVEIVPGITGMSGCWTATGHPITWGDDVMTVLMGTLNEDDLATQMAASDAIVVMKTGRNLPKVRNALARAGRLDAAWVVEHGTMKNQNVCKLSDVSEVELPYFAIVIVHGQGRRP